MLLACFRQVNWNQAWNKRRCIEWYVSTQAMLKKSNQKWGTVHQRNSLKGDFNRKRDDTVMTSHYKTATWPAHVEGQHLPEAGGYKSMPWKFKIDHVYIYIIYIYQNGGLEKVRSIEFLVILGIHDKIWQGCRFLFQIYVDFQPDLFGENSKYQNPFGGECFQMTRMRSKRLNI